MPLSALIAYWWCPGPMATVRLVCSFWPDSSAGIGILFGTRLAPLSHNTQNPLQIALAAISAHSCRFSAPKWLFITPNTFNTQEKNTCQRAKGSKARPSNEIVQNVPVPEGRVQFHLPIPVNIHTIFWENIYKVHPLIREVSAGGNQQIKCRHSKRRRRPLRPDCLNNSSPVRPDWRNCRRIWSGRGTTGRPVLLLAAKKKYWECQLSVPGVFQEFEVYLEVRSRSWNLIETNAVRRWRISCRRCVSVASCVSCVGSGTKSWPEFRSGAGREQVPRVPVSTGSAASRNGVPGRAAGDRRRRSALSADVPASLRHPQPAGPLTANL